MKNMTPNELRALADAAQSLDDWRATVEDRDNRIRNAHAAGMSKTEIADRMKLSRNTVITVVGDDSTEEG